MKINLIPIALLVLSIPVLAQEAPVFNNSGTLAVYPQTTVTSVFPFDNKDSGTVVMDGDFYLLDKYTNNGDFWFSSDKGANSRVYFVQDATQLVSGAKTSLFKNVVFKNKGTNLSNSIAVSGVSDFETGVVTIDNEGVFTYTKGGVVGAVSDASFVDGVVDRVGNDVLILPIGNKDKYRTAIFGDSNSTTDVFTGQYFLANPLAAYPKQTDRSPIEVIDNQEYWEVKRSGGSNGLLLSLSYDESTTPAELLNDVDNKLGIVRWDDAEKKWVNEGGIVDASSKMISIPVEVNDFGIFTLATVDKDFVVDDSVVIYNAVSPNGDGMNDYFIIKNINLFPNNTVRIYNRWGAKVYEASNYDPSGVGTSNVFAGHAEGKGVLGKEKLPSGTYFYDVRYEKTDKGGSEIIKKAGYLHLEND